MWLDTSGAYIPGHGTPTVILFGRHRAPLGDTVRAVMGIKAEPSTAIEPAQGLVWSAIVRQVDHPGSESEFVNVGDTSRTTFAKHPWSIGGGGAADLKELIESASGKTVGQIAIDMGVFGMTNADESMLAPAMAFERQQVEGAYRRPLVRWVIWCGTGSSQLLTRCSFHTSEERLYLSTTCRSLPDGSGRVVRCLVTVQLSAKHVL